MTTSSKFTVERQIDVEKIISKQIDTKDFTPLNIYELKNYCYYGFSSDKLRPKYWKVLLGYYERNKFKSKTYYDRQRASYVSYLEDLDKENDNELFDVIENDIKRTMLKPLTNDDEDVSTEIKCEFLDLQAIKKSLTHRKIVERILKCFSIHNKSIGYIQGMNMLLIPIYYVFTNSDDIDDNIHAEEDAFFCFNYLMSEIYGNFISDIDEKGNKSAPVHSERVYEIIKNEDEELYNICAEKKIFETCICVKWNMFIFSTEFSIDKLLWLWDRLLGDKRRFEIVLYCSASIFVIMKDVLKTEDFDQCLELLQKPSIVDMEVLFNTADAIRLKNFEKQNYAKFNEEIDSKE